MKGNYLIEVCKLLNNEKVLYAIVGGWAVILHGYLRTTYDIDILIQRKKENADKLKKALKSLTWGIIEEISAEEIISKPFTIIGDQPRVDIITYSGKINYKNIKDRILIKKVDGVKIPYVDIDVLIKMKATGRLHDLEDIEKLKLIKKIKNNKNRI